MTEPLIVFEVDFNDLATLDGKKCVLTRLRRGSRNITPGERVIANDEPEGMTLPGNVLKIEGEKVWIHCDWWDTPWTRTES